MSRNTPPKKGRKQKDPLLHVETTEKKAVKVATGRINSLAKQKRIAHKIPDFLPRTSLCLLLKAQRPIKYISWLLCATCSFVQIDIWQIFRKKWVEFLMLQKKKKTQEGRNTQTHCEFYSQCLERAGGIIRQLHRRKQTN